MTTPLQTPVTLNLTLETQEDVLALLLRANLDDGNLRTWYHDYRDRPNVIVPEVRMTELYHALKAVMEREGFSMERSSEDCLPAPVNVDVRFS